MVFENSMPSLDDLDTIERIVHDLKQDSAASKRKRHALSMAKGRMRQRDMLTTLRSQRAHLQAMLQRALDMRAHGQQTKAASSFDIKLQHASSLPLDLDDDRAADFPQSPDSVRGGSEHAAIAASSASIASLFQEYVAAVEVQNSMHDEIESLQKRIEQYAIFEAALMIDTSMLLADPSSAATDESLRRASPVNCSNSTNAARRGVWTQFMDGEEPFYFEPFEQLVAHELMRAMHVETMRFNAAFVHRNIASPSSENSCLGWNVQRSVTDKRHLQFYFTKRVPCACSATAAATMVDETWRTFHSPERYARLYRTVMVSRVIQHIDASTSVILRNSPSNNRTHDVRMVTMVTKRSNDVDALGRRTHSVLTLVVEPPESALRLPGVVFIRNAYTYLTFTEIASDNASNGPMIEITYGGHGDCLNEAHAAHLLVETGAALVRWEQVVCPQRLVTAQ